MDLTKLTQNEEIPIVVTTNFDVDSFVKGYHEYKSIWTPKIGEILSTERESGNLVDKYAVCVKKENEIVGHLPLEKDGKFAKTVFYFLRADEYGSCNVLIKGKLVNLGDGDGMQVSCTLNIVDRKKFIFYFAEDFTYLQINIVVNHLPFFSIGLAMQQNQEKYCSPVLWHRL